MSDVFIMAIHFFQQEKLLPILEEVCVISSLSYALYGSTVWCSKARKQKLLLSAECIDYTCKLNKWLFISIYLYLRSMIGTPKRSPGSLGRYLWIYCVTMVKNLISKSMSSQSGNWTSWRKRIPTFVSR